MKHGRFKTVRDTVLNTVQELEHGKNYFRFFVLQFNDARITFLQKSYSISSSCKTSDRNADLEAFLAYSAEKATLAGNDVLVHFENRFLAFNF